VLGGGTPGTGKSTLAAGLADALGGVLLRSDRLRKELAGLDPGTGAAAPWETGLYAPDVTGRTYDELFRRAGDLLAMGETVILDATWPTSRARERARAVARACSSPVVELRCCAPDDVVAARIAARGGAGDPSDADADVARRVASEFEDWPEAVVLDTTQGIAGAVSAASRAVRPEAVG
jgi:uncharacterized protein